MDKDIIIVSIGILGPVLSVVVTAFGLFLQYKKDKVKSDSDAKKVDSEAEKVRADAYSLYTKTDMETINFYVGMVNSLRDEVRNFTDILNKSEDEKRKLSAENELLRARVTKAEKRVSELEEEVALLKQFNIKK